MRIALPLMVLLLAASPSRGEAVSNCLPVEAGQAVSALVESDRFQSLIGPDWSLESANIEISRLVLTLKADPDMRLGVVLSREGPGSVPGKWFAYEFFNSLGPPSEKDLELLLGAANLIDQAFDSSPWVACLEAPKATGESPDGFNPNTDKNRAAARHAPVPSWLYLLLGLVQLVALLLGLFSALWNRTPPPVRSGS